jgi:DNA mismatch repair protein MutS2
VRRPRRTLRKRINNKKILREFEMNKLGEKSLKTLEYYEILEKLAGQAASQAAKEKCRALRPLDDHEQAELWLQQTTDAKDLMVRQGSPAFGGIREVGAILSRADRGGTLNPRELLAVASLLQTARRALLYDAEHETKTTLTPVFGLLSGNRDLEESITTAIISEEEIADGASPELLSIRRELRRVSGKVRETLNRMISGERSKYLQENIITQRNGRFVVPVKVECPVWCMIPRPPVQPCSSSRSRSWKSTTRLRCSRAARKTKLSAFSRSCRRACPCTRAPSSRTTMR